MVVAEVSLYPLRMVIDQHQYHSTHGCTCVIDVQSRQMVNREMTMVVGELL